jgi:hypothetical protein
MSISRYRWLSAYIAVAGHQWVLRRCRRWAALAGPRTLADCHASSVVAIAFWGPGCPSGLISCAV